MDTLHWRTLTHGCAAPSGGTFPLQRDNAHRRKTNTSQEYVGKLENASLASKLLRSQFSRAFMKGVGKTDETETPRPTTGDLKDQPPQNTLTLTLTLTLIATRALRSHGSKTKLALPFEPGCLWLCLHWA